MMRKTGRREGTQGALCLNAGDVIEELLNKDCFFSFREKNYKFPLHLVLRF